MDLSLNAKVQYDSFEFLDLLYQVQPHLFHPLQTDLFELVEVDCLLFYQWLAAGKCPTLTVEDISPIIFSSLECVMYIAEERELNKVDFEHIVLMGNLPALDYAYSKLNTEITEADLQYCLSTNHDIQPRVLLSLYTKGIISMQTWRAGLVREYTETSVDAWLDVHKAYSENTT